MMPSRKKMALEQHVVIPLHVKVLAKYMVIPPHAKKVLMRHTAFRQGLEQKSTVLVPQTTYTNLRDEEEELDSFSLSDPVGDGPWKAVSCQIVENKTRLSDYLCLPVG